MRLTYKQQLEEEKQFKANTQRLKESFKPKEKGISVFGKKDIRVEDLTEEMKEELTERGFNNNK